MKRASLKRKTRLKPSPTGKKARARRRKRGFTMTPEDIAWARAVKERHGWRCLKCGTYFGPGSSRSPRGLEAAHIFSRNNPHVRLDIENGVPLCHYHHIYWAHRQPAEFVEWIRREILGEERYEALRVRAMQSDGAVTLARDGQTVPVEVAHG